eukprot:scaffold21360_cov112-Isochrysis_galbana.AAC.2
MGPMGIGQARTSRLLLAILNSPTRPEGGMAARRLRARRVNWVDAARLNRVGILSRQIVIDGQALAVEVNHVRRIIGFIGRVARGELVQAAVVIVGGACNKLAIPALRRGCGSGARAQYCFFTPRRVYSRPGALTDRDGQGQLDRIEEALRGARLGDNRAGRELVQIAVLPERGLNLNRITVDHARRCGAHVDEDARRVDGVVGVYLFLLHEEAVVDDPRHPAADQIYTAERVQRRQVLKFRDGRAQREGDDGGGVGGLAVKCVGPAVQPVGRDEGRAIGTCAAHTVRPAVHIFPRLASPVDSDVSEHVDHRAGLPELEAIVAVDKYRAAAVVRCEAKELLKRRCTGGVRDIEVLSRGYGNTWECEILPGSTIAIVNNANAIHARVGHWTGGEKLGGFRLAIGQWAVDDAGERQA